MLFELTEFNSIVIDITKRDIQHCITYFTLLKFIFISVNFLHYLHLKTKFSVSVYGTTNID